MRVALTALVALALAAPGCGGDGDDGDASTTQATETAAATTQATVPAEPAKPQKPVRPPSPEPKTGDAPKIESAAAYRDAREFCALFDAKLLQKQYGGDSAAAAARSYVEGVYPPELQDAATKGCIAGVKP